MSIKKVVPRFSNLFIFALCSFVLSLGIGLLKDKLYQAPHV